jgi:hypothetical protein
MTDSTAGARLATSFLNCPRCGLSISLRSRSLSGRRVLDRRIGQLASGRRRSVLTCCAPLV